MCASGETIPAVPVAYLELAALPIAPFWARCQTRLVLDWWNLCPATIEIAVLLVSELVTNAAVFADPATPDFGYSEPRAAPLISLTLRHLGRTLRIEVTDPNPEAPVLSKADMDAETGRGLMLVQALSHEWSYFLSPSGGKTVYCVIATTEAKDAQSAQPEADAQ